MSKCYIVCLTGTTTVAQKLLAVKFN